MSYRRDDQDGAILVMCLIFITVFGLIMGALLSQAQAHMRNTNVVSQHQAKVYAAGSGIDHAIDVLRSANQLCPNPAAGQQPIPSITVGGQTVSITCQTTAGSSTGVLGWAVITRQTTPGVNSLYLQGGQQKEITGPVYVSGDVSWGPSLLIHHGDFYQRAKPSSTCAASRTAPTSSQLSFDTKPPYDWYCDPSDATNPIPDAPHAQPTSIPGPNNPTPVSFNGCTTYLPGTYDVAPTISTSSYFASGTYYFKTGQLNIKQVTVLGGQPDAFETSSRRFPAPAAGTCGASDPTTAAFPAATGVNGTGVEFIFGGTSSVYVDTQGNLELFARNGTDGGQQGMSIVAVPSDWTGSYVHGTASPVLGIKDGDPQQMAIHGLVYAPDADVQLTATNSSLAQILAGVECNTLQLQSSASAQGLAISVATGEPANRQIVLQATAGASGERQVVATAVVLVNNDATRTASIQSWRESYSPS